MKFAKVDVPTRGSAVKRCSMLRYGRSRQDVSRARMKIFVSSARSLANMRSKARSVRRKKRTSRRCFSIGAPGRSRRRTRNRPRRNGLSCLTKLPNVRFERKRKPYRVLFLPVAQVLFPDSGQRRREEEPVHTILALTGLRRLRL